MSCVPGDYLASGSSDENVLVFKTNFVPPTSISEPPVGGVRSHSDLSDLRQSASVAASLERERERERPPIDNTNSYDFSGMPGSGTLHTCFTRTKVQILTPEELRVRRHGARVERRQRAQAQRVSAERRGDVSARQRGAHFPCFASTEVQILTRSAAAERCWRSWRWGCYSRVRKCAVWRPRQVCAPVWGRAISSYVGHAELGSSGSAAAHAANGGSRTHARGDSWRVIP